MRGHRLQLTLAVLAVPLLLTGCTQQANQAPKARVSSAPASATPTSTETPTAKPSPSASASMASPTTSTSAALHGCGTSELTAKLSDENGAAGTAYYDFVFTNNSATACTVKGYPNVDVVYNGDGSQLGVQLSHQYWAYEPDSKKIPQLTVKPNGGKVYVQLALPSIYNYATGKAVQDPYKQTYNSTCGKALKADGYRLRLPGETAAFYVAVKGGFPYCDTMKQAFGRNSEFVPNPTID